MQDSHKYIEYTVENFINLIINEKLKKERLIADIKNSNITEKFISKTLQKVDFAYKRISEPLENDIKYLLLIFPFGIANRFNQKGFFDLEKNRKLGFVKKTEEYNKYSSIGLILYAIILISAIIFFHINKIS